MDTDGVIGIILIALSLGAITGLVLWSRRAIHLIGKKDLKSAREIERELGNGR